MTFTQVFLSLFLLFAVSRVVLRFRDGEVPAKSALFWIFVFTTAFIAVVFPRITGNVAEVAGIGRGVDVVVYVAVALLFYLVFRLYVYMQDLRHEITTLVRKLALKDSPEKNDKKPAKN